ncbi:hypothetical protein J437_LFUL010963 [Ladona fulva]|uniref:Uncharacterized protein n=1 Tax=Ladona fulva TaxID=123851 RepID=A0A8K0KHM8_LADFU|nr:hypothetical protein J437_LFUL010963 [Ladona fulva]
MVYTLPAKERIRRRFGSSRYIVSKAGITKILAIILLMAAGILFLTENGSRKCRSENDDLVKAPEWFPWLFPLATVASAAISAIIYAAYLLQLAKRSLKVWVILDLTVSMVLIIAALIISILVITSCKPIKTVNYIPGVSENIQRYFL